MLYKYYFIDCIIFCLEDVFFSCTMLSISFSIWSYSKQWEADETIFWRTQYNSDVGLSVF